MSKTTDGFGHLQPLPPPPPPPLPSSGDAKRSISGVIARIYEAAPALERHRMLEQLVTPLGALAVAAIANGAFIRIWYRRDWHAAQGAADLASVRATDVASLVDFVQQASFDTIASLGSWCASAPALGGVAAVALLGTLLLQRERTRARHAPGGDAARS